MKSFVLVMAVLVASPALFAQGQQTAPLMVSARVQPSCAIDVRDDGRLRLNCGADTLRRARVSVDGLSAAPVTMLAASSQERVFLLPAAAAILASAGHALPALELTPHDIIVTIEF